MATHDRLRHNLLHLGRHGCRGVRRAAAAGVSHERPDGGERGTLREERARAVSVQTHEAEKKTTTNRGCALWRGGTGVVRDARPGDACAVARAATERGDD